ncbi:MAG: hypothetical protein DMG64_19810 [Acidobacteria bacterium]|nr:MAG: hypothetical protein DMG64_19810 [Acidobacteriota bacterium]PYY19112.1 MAG: hypothetical protein DMG62_24950 [Acidobacteriota bacterium]HEU0046582.1 hypothetical protein [Nitrososphaera sp.]
MVKHPILSTILLSLAVASEAQVSTKAEPLYVSMLQLISTPEKFDGKLVSVIGYLRFELHGNLLFVHREDEENGILSNSIRTSLDGRCGKDLELFDSKYVKILGIFHAGDARRNPFPPGVITDASDCKLWSDPREPLNRKLERIPGVH